MDSQVFLYRFFGEMRKNKENIWTPTNRGPSYEGGDSECLINYLYISIKWKYGQIMNKL